MTTQTSGTGVRNGAQYLEGLRDQREVWLRGERVAQRLFGVEILCAGFGGFLVIHPSHLSHPLLRGPLPASISPIIRAV